MYMMIKSKKQGSFYQNFTPRTMKHKDVEMKVYVSNAVSKDVSSNMKVVVENISTKVIYGLSLKED